MKKDYSKESTKKNKEEVNKEQSIIKKELKGKVNCDSLYVRQNYSKESEPLAIINYGDTVEIYEDDKVKDFYKVKTKKGIEGYCMKKFINII